MDPEIERVVEERRIENLSVERFLGKAIRNDVAREMFEVFNFIQKEGEFSQDDYRGTMGGLFEKNSEIVKTFYASKHEDSQQSISEGMQSMGLHESDSQPDSATKGVEAKQLREEKKQR
jgi:hypothetical protein